MNIFTYGTLMYSEIWEKIVQNEYSSKPAFVTGFKRLKVKQETFPALIRNQRDLEVHGKVYFDIRYDDMKRIESFEGKSYKVMDSVCHIEDSSYSNESDLTVGCKLYLWRTEYKSLLSSDQWEPEWFEERGLREYKRRLNDSLF